MLVLSRKAKESIVIDGNVTVTVVSIAGNKVRLAISAPPEVRIDREEIHRARQEFSDDYSHELVGAGQEA
jgi:carbon storage regulator